MAKTNCPISEARAADPRGRAGRVSHRNRLRPGRQCAGRGGRRGGSSKSRDGRRPVPLIVHVDSIEMARGLAREWPAAAETLARAYWPGPLTLVVPKRPEVPDIVTAGLDTVGLRMPRHPLALELIRAAGVPIAAPSANRFTETLADHGRARAANRWAMRWIACWMAGPTAVGIESTVISLAGRPVLLRPGMIPREEIEARIGPVEMAGAVEGAHPSPGMHPRHYSPRTPVILGAPPPAGRGRAFVYDAARRRRRA